ncbi:hypothetical protein [uncultured Paraglaciecola sp.]|uniref:hypothetical protein n=1 Tax=uncultured Paraglaciecola sp. TaxID=1765024 RepID=UPI002615EAF9|nr:hypothetical protein [uncultured Paraglaciecola sp.]
MEEVNKHHMVVWAKALSLALFIVTMLIFLPLLYHFGVALKPAAKVADEGIVTIQPSDFSERKTLALT